MQNGRERKRVLSSFWTLKCERETRGQAMEIIVSCNRMFIVSGIMNYHKQI